VKHTTTKDELENPSHGYALNAEALVCIMFRLLFCFYIDYYVGILSFLYLILHSGRRNCIFVHLSDEDSKRRTISW